jgi:hypothetical protein
MTAHRYLIFGGRDFTDRAAIFHFLDRLHTKTGISCVIEGEARGADRLACEWAEQRCVAVDRYHEDWGTHGNSAVHIRNARMIAEGRPGGAVGFPGGRARATWPISLTRPASWYGGLWTGFDEDIAPWQQFTISRVGQSTGIRELEPHRTLNGQFDAYCRICWNPVYALWVDSVDPEGKCMFGHGRAEECPDAMAAARNSAVVAKLRRDGLIYDPKESRS